MSLEEVEDADDVAATADEPKPRLNLEIGVASPSACQRHVTVTIPREDIDRYFQKAFTDMMDSAAVPGFRAGRAPRKLVETRYRKEVAEQVKNSLLLDSMSQINDEQKLAAISEPDLDVTVVKIPDEGPMSFEFDLEVRPDFELPNWRGLKIERPTREFTPADIDQQLSRVLQPYGRLVPHDGPVGPTDHVTVNITSQKDGKTLLRREEQTLALAPALSFQDGTLAGFDKLLLGASRGGRRTAKLKLTEDAPNEELRGQEIDLEFEVLDVKKFELPELSHEFLQRLPYGPFEAEEDLRQAIEKSLQRQLEYEQQQKARGQITRILTEAANWELPPEMLKRQSERELQRSVLELRRSGFSEAEIRGHENRLRQNSTMETARALREHFILERIAEDEKIEAEPSDYDHEVRLIAAQSNDTPRRVRAQLEKRGLMDSLHNQIIERKTIERVLGEATFKDVAFEPPRKTTEALEVAIGGGSSTEIPEALHGEAGKGLAEVKVHHHQ